MRKKVFGRQLSRGRKAREALFRALIRALVINGRITTTKAKAKAVVPLAERLINIAKENSVAARRKVLSRVGNDRLVTELIFKKIVPALSGKTSGFTRIILLPPRRGDAAEMAILEWSEKVEMVEPAKKEKEKKSEKETKKKLAGKTKNK